MLSGSVSCSSRVCVAFLTASSAMPATRTNALTSMPDALPTLATATAGVD